jgi:fibronectin type 3 domain-containing protein
LTRAVRARKPQARLLLEVCESRLAPAVVGVDAAANVHAIDPNVYGAAFASTSQITDLRLPINRNGGNASDTYSLAQDATNHASDWFFESIASGSGNGQGIDSWISNTKAGGAQPSVTLNLFDWAAKLGANRSNLGSFSVAKYGPQQSTDPWNSNWGNGVHTDGTNITGNDPNDAYVPNSPTAEQAWIQHLIATFGNSQNGGVQYYTLGNEPGLWNSTHRDIHPAGDTLTELRDRIINYASMVKGLDPGAKIVGPEEWGWTNYFISGADAAAHNWGATYNGLNAEAWLLDQLRQHDAATGQRLLDYFTLHFYPQGGQFGNDVSTNMELLRNRSTRSLWDPNYVDESWIASTGINGGKVNLINQMKNWVNTYYPGTKIGITEYNWGAEGNMNGATTQADIFGIFGREGLNLANRWTTPATGSPTYLAMKMFRNYDGNGSGFGETSVGASVDNPDQVDAFASLRASDGALTIMVINKNLFDSSNPSATTSITLNLSNFASAGTAQEWQLAAINPSDQTQAAITRLSDLSVGGNSITLTVPMESVSMFVLAPASTAPAAPTGLTAVPADAKVTLSWNAVAGAASYNIYRSTASGAETLVQSGVTGTTFSDTGLTDGTTYYYKVSAVNAAGESPLSAEVSATPQVAAPAAPTGLTAVPADAQVALSWNAVGGAASYNVYRGTASGAETLVQSGVTGTTFSDTGLTDGTTYYYKVSAVNAAGESPLSAEVSATPQVAAPAAPSNLSATAASTSQINLTWTDNSSNESGFVVEWATNSTFTAGDTTANVGANVTSYSATGLSAGTTYWFRVRATNAGGASANSNVASATTQTASTGTGTGLVATYYDNMDFTGTTVSRTDATVNFNFGTGSPVSGIAPFTYSIRWTGQVQAVESGSYRFRTVSDDGVRLWVNGQLVINNWTNHAPTTNTSAAVTLTAGQKYTIKMEYYQNGGGAVARLLWERPGQTTYAVIPQAQLYPPATGNGLQATYFTNTDLTGTTVSRTDATVNFNWGTSSPASGITAGHFSARWTGEVQAVETGTYTFRTYSEGGVRLWVNGQLIINDWTNHAPTYDTGTITLQAGQLYTIKLEYFADTAGAVMELDWMRPGQSTFGAIPQTNLFS